MLHVTTTCSNAKDDIYLVINFFTTAAEWLFSLSFVVCDTDPKNNSDSFSTQQLYRKLTNGAANQHKKFIGTTPLSYQKLANLFSAAMIAYISEPLYVVALSQAVSPEAVEHLID